MCGSTVPGIENSKDVLLGKIFKKKVKTKLLLHFVIKFRVVLKDPIGNDNEKKNITITIY